MTQLSRRLTIEGRNWIRLIVGGFHACEKNHAEIMGRLDHQFINDLEPFKTVNPSAENMAKYF